MATEIKREASNQEIEIDKIKRPNTPRQPGGLEGVFSWHSDRRNPSKLNRYDRSRSPGSRKRSFDSSAYPRFPSIPTFFPGAGIRSGKEAMASAIDRTGCQRSSANGVLREVFGTRTSCENHGDGVPRGSRGTCRDLDRWRRDRFVMETHAAEWPGGFVWRRMGALVYIRSRMVWHGRGQPMHQALRAEGNGNPWT
ncbi:uncharacterized protein [Elaeis guineensis]|uniref:uncharacterized protein n=1 Tax=Elaeis guineensis var. tenera TaxID=51953 RepID=UPI003C6D2973